MVARENKNVLILNKYEKKVSVDIKFCEKNCDECIKKNISYKKHIRFPPQWKACCGDYSKETDLNVGILTGKVNDLIVIDIDTNDALNWFVDNFGKLENLGCSCIKTKRGFHLYFKYDDRLSQVLKRCSTNSFKNYVKGIDIRGDGGLVFFGDNYDCKVFKENPDVIPESVIKYLTETIEEKVKPIRENYNKEISETPLEYNDETLLRVSWLLDQFDKSRVENFDEWIKVGLALKNSFGEEGRKMFIEFSKMSSLHNETNESLSKWYDNLIPLKNGKKITYFSLYYMYEKDFGKKFNNKHNDMKNKENNQKQVAVDFIKSVNEPNITFGYVDGVFWYNNNGIWEQDLNEYYLQDYLTKFKVSLTDISKYKKIIEWMRRLLGNFKVVFSPYRDVSKNEINLFQGFKAKYIGGIVEDDIKDFLNHIKLINCRDITSRYEYILNWFSFLLKVGKNETAPVFFGEAGTGKTTPFEYMCEWIIGYKYSMVESNMSKVFGRFNSHRCHMILILLDEARSDKNNYMSTFQQIKDSITGHRFSAESKGKNMQEQSENLNSFAYCSNYQKSVLIEDNDRRFSMFGVSNNRMGDADYFINLHNIMDNQDYANKVYSFLIDRNLDNFNPRLNIFTQEARETQLQSSSVGLFIKDLIDEESENYIFKGTEKYITTSKDLYEKYIHFYHDKEIFDFKKFDNKTFGVKFRDLYGKEFVEDKRNTTSRSLIIKKI